MLRTYEEFAQYIESNGFMPMSTNKPSFPSLTSLTEDSAWHTNEATDPWIWRKRIADEKRAAYAKVFEKKPGFISLSCYPYFLTLRRGEASVADLYGEGKISYMAKTLHDLFLEHPEIPAHSIKSLLSVGSDSKNEVDNALTELQMHLFLTISGAARKTNPKGEEYGWPSMIYTLTENWVPADVLETASKTTWEDAKTKLLAKARQVLPDLDEKRVLKFILL